MLSVPSPTKGEGFGVPVPPVELREGAIRLQQKSPEYLMHIPYIERHKRLESDS